MKIFAYADETEFLLNKTNSSIVGSGILITEKEISQSVIDIALNSLRKELILDKNDVKTIKNGYFHASSDSKSAHWHLCESINSLVNGYFKYSYHNQSLSKKASSIENLNKRTLELAVIPLIDYKFEEVTLIIEGRSQFNQQQSERWIENLYRILEVTLYNQNSFVTYFPKINIQVADKRNPGLQVIDFILWAQNRTQNNDSRWFDNLRLIKSSSHTIEDSPSFGGSYYVNKMIEFPLPRLGYPFNKADENNHNDIIRSYLLMEQTILLLFKLINNLPLTIQHLKLKITNTAVMLIKANKSLSQVLIEEMASTYLRIFDTLPLYLKVKEDDKGTWQVLLFSKHIAALLRRKGYLNNSRTVDAISYWKYHTDEAEYSSGLLPIQEFLRTTIDSQVPK